ncbi:MAG TPA: AIR synthase related protein, partial [Methanocorpusculum sp.]|nr:AIR synthase related protein [Methanocorpusculum sp.]
MAYSYKDAGVDIDLEADGVKSLIKMLSYRRCGEHGMVGDVGHFSGLIDFGDKVLSLCTDGVGTKMRVADDLKDWHTVGIDCMAMNVNDMYVMNIEPVAFVDYIATEGIDKEQ